MPTIHYRSGEEVTLKEAQDLVGGYVQLLSMPDGRQMLVDEDGLMKRLLPNITATVLTDGQYGVIVGDVVVLSGEARWV